MNKTMTAAVGNGIGVYVYTPSTGSSASDRVYIGGIINPPFDFNIISGNASHGIVVQRDAGADRRGAVDL